MLFRGWSKTRLMGVTWLPREMWAPVPETPTEVEPEPVPVARVGMPRAEELLWKAISRDREVQVRVLALLEECRREAANNS